MTYKQAKQIIENDESVSIEEYQEAIDVVQVHEEKLNKIKKPKASLKAYQNWMKRNKEQTELKNLLKKYWTKSS